jgi:oxygen-independent coproporphyrinogen-3 oxidase
MKYWKLEPYAGFGADAHSFDGRARRRNPESLEEYLGRGPAVDEAPHAAERFFVGLRLSEGIRPTAAEWTRYAEPIHRFNAAGLTESSGGVLRLTGRGVMLSNEVLQEFLDE